MQELLKYTVVNPAKNIKIDIGEIKVGMRADLVLFDPEQSTIVEDKGSLYNTQELSGSVVSSFVGLLK